MGLTKVLNSDEIKEHFLKAAFYLKYNPKTGVFTRKRRYFKSHIIGEQVGSISNRYINISFKGKTIQAHRLAWLFTYGDMPELIDHKNGKRSDNRISNLREATHIQNIQNQPNLRKNNKSGFTGVFFVKSSNKFAARIKVSGKEIQLGCFKTAELASNAYKNAKKYYHPFSFNEDDKDFLKLKKMNKQGVINELQQQLFDAQKNVRFIQNNEESNSSDLYYNKGIIDTCNKVLKMMKERIVVN